MATVHYPQLNGLLCDLLIDQTKKTPSNFAVITPAQQFTYAQLLHHAQMVAVILVTKHRVKKLESVGTCFEKNSWMAVAAYGAWFASAAYIPFDAHIPEKRMSTICVDANIRVVLTAHELSQARAWPSEAVRLVLDKDPLPQSKPLPPPQLKTLDFAYAIFTSGSTGKPKVTSAAHTRPVTAGCGDRRVWCVTAGCGDRSPSCAEYHSRLQRRVANR